MKKTSKKSSLNRRQVNEHFYFYMMFFWILEHLDIWYNILFIFFYIHIFWKCHFCCYLVQRRRARFDEVNVREGQQFCLTFFGPFILNANNIFYRNFIANSIFLLHHMTNLTKIIRPFTSEGHTWGNKTSMRRKVYSCLLILWAQCSDAFYDRCCRPYKIWCPPIGPRARIWTCLI